MKTDGRFQPSVDNSSIKTGLRKVQNKTSRPAEYVHESPQHVRQYAAKQPSLASSGMVQSSVTTGSISGSVAGNYQSYSVSGSMKREHSNESGSLMRS